MAKPNRSRHSERSATQWSAVELSPEHIQLADRGYVAGSYSAGHRIYIVQRHFTSGDSSAALTMTALLGLVAHSQRAGDRISIVRHHFTSGDSLAALTMTALMGHPPNPTPHKPQSHYLCHSIRNMIEAGRYYKLKVVKRVDFGLYLDAEGEEILLPRRFVPRDAKEDDELEVFVYHDNEQRLIATTQKPLATVGEIALLKAVSVTPPGAFLEWGIMKDVFLPLSQQASRIHEGKSYLVYLYIDQQTGRVTATEKLDRYITNDELTVSEGDQVDLVVWQQTDIGYKVIINSKHTGVLHFNDVFRDLEYGEKLTGYIKKVREENKIDIGLGEKGYKRVMSETDKILSLLRENDGYLPYSDKSSPEDIYEFFGVSKKTFKMAVGALYKERKIELTQTGMRLADTGE